MRYITDEEIDLINKGFDDDGVATYLSLKIKLEIANQLSRIAEQLKIKNMDS